MKARGLLGLGLLGLPLALLALQALGPVAGEWVQVPVIGVAGGKKHPQQQTTVSSSSTTTPSPLPSPPVGAPGPSVDDVITIRRTVGDSFSNKEAVVVAPQSHADEGDGAAEDDVQDAGEQPGPGDDADDGDAGGGLPLRELREAHQTLLRQSAAPVSGKLDFLRRLKNRLLRHIASLAPLSALSLAGAAGPGGGGGAATGRAAGLEGRGHKGVGFPSNEGTLMSLAFLVFAVFLVKVVTQLIYAVQYNQANSAGVRVAQMQIPDTAVPSVLPAGMMPGVMGTMMNMVPAVAGMMPPMMAAMQPTMGGRGARALPAGGSDDGGDVRVAEDVDRMAARVLEAIHNAKTRLARLQPQQRGEHDDHGNQGH